MEPIPALDAVEVSFDDTVDVVVVGLGVAGTSAVVAARQAGAEVLAVERSAGCRGRPGRPSFTRKARLTGAVRAAGLGKFLIGKARGATDPSAAPSEAAESGGDRLRRKRCIHIGTECFIGAGRVRPARCRHAGAGFHPLAATSPRRLQCPPAWALLEARVSSCPLSMASPGR